MIPSTFTQLETMPLTINGKLDKKALPEPDFININTYVAPRTELEQKLCKVWQEVLGLEKIGINDNFFRIGGDSIVSIQLVTKLRQLEFNLQVKDIFNFPTILQLAENITHNNTVQIIDAEQGLLTGEFPLLPIQEWFFSEKLIEPNHFNQSFMLCIPGYITVPAVENALELLRNRHDMLRCSFTTTGQIYHKNTDNFMAPLDIIDISTVSEQMLHNRLDALHKKLDIHNGPLWQVVYLNNYPDGLARLCFIFHHLIIDAVSWRIIANDIEQLLTSKSFST